MSAVRRRRRLENAVLGAISLSGLALVIATAPAEPSMAQQLPMVAPVEDPASQPLDVLEPGVEKRRAEQLVATGVDDALWGIAPVGAIAALTIGVLVGWVRYDARQRVRVDPDA